MEAVSYTHLVGPTEVQVDLGCKQAGYISAEELSADPSVKPEDMSLIHI